MQTSILKKEETPKILAKELKLGDSFRWGGKVGMRVVDRWMDSKKQESPISPSILICWLKDNEVSRINPEASVQPVDVIFVERAGII